MLLGPLTVRVAATGTPTAAVGRKPYLSELLAYLATRPHGATTEEVADAMRINPDRVRKDIHTLRTWLGTNPKTGRPHIPDSRQTKAAKTRGQPAYQIEDLQIDADLFRRLRTRAQTRGPAGIQDLKQALTLVKGTPFSQLRRDGGAWLAQGNRLDQILQCAIIDVAHTITTAALAQGDHTTAQQTAELAATIAPAEETPQLDLATASQPKDTTKQPNNSSETKSTTAATKKTKSQPNYHPEPKPSSTHKPGTPETNAKHQPEHAAH